MSDIRSGDLQSPALVDLGSADASPRPLDGVRVVEIGMWHAAPCAGAILGDLGADVIKVETMDGDPLRNSGLLGPMRNVESLDKPGWNVSFETANRSKRAICLDITQHEGRDVFNRLLETADIFITNLRPLAKQKLGIAYELLAEQFPRLVHLSVSGFGNEGPLAKLSGYDPAGPSNLRHDVLHAGCRTGDDAAHSS